MRPHSRRFPRRRGSSPLRPREWWGFVTSATLNLDEPSALSLNPGFSSIGWILSPNDAQEFFDRPTLVRLLFRITCITNLGSESFNQTWNTVARFGIILWRSDEASIDNIDSNDYTHDWIWYDQIILYHFVDEVTGISALPAQSGPFQGVIDVRSKRKIPDGYGIAMVLTNDESSDTGIHVASAGRLLVLNH